jgi:S-adenosylmethionine:tRNA ribosyltransferase-isomerase
MRVDLFDFELPQERIALRPAEPRDSARLLAIDPAQATQPFTDCNVGALPDLLSPGDVLVVNDTKVIPARLRGIRDRNGNIARIEVTLHKRQGDDSWLAFAKPAKRLRAGDRLRFGGTSDSFVCEMGHLDAVVAGRNEAGEVLLEFALTGAALDDAIERIGEMPLPPYIAGRRAADIRDGADYQTLFARQSGAVAAPTASLHFTPALLEALQARGIDIVEVTLHVGAGTYLPVKAADTHDHVMHSEFGIITQDAAARLNAARREGARIVAAGTTSLRILETAARDDGEIEAIACDTSIFITPGYRFKAVDILLTNFHLPRSTLFMLVSSFCGLDVMQAAYAHAIEKQYRFYSYGDACLLFRAETVQDENAADGSTHAQESKVLEQ